MMKTLNTDSAIFLSCVSTFCFAWSDLRFSSVTQDIIAILVQGTGGSIAAFSNTREKTDFVRVALLFLQNL